MNTFFDLVEFILPRYEFTFLFIFCMLVPLIALVMGLLYINYPPRENSFWGFNPWHSTNSKVAWIYAQRAYGKLLIWESATYLIISFAFLFVFVRTRMMPTGIMLNLLTLIILTSQFIARFFVKKALNKRFKSEDQLQK